MNKKEDEYKILLEKSFEASFLWGRLNLLNDSIDNEFKAKLHSNQFKTYIFTPFLCFGLLSVYKKYNEYLPKGQFKKIAIITVPGLFGINLFTSWLESDVKYKEMRSFLMSRYEQQLLALIPSLREAKIRCSVSGQQSPPGDFRDFPNQNTNYHPQPYQQPNYGNSYNQPFQSQNFNTGNAQSSFNPGNAQPYQQPNFGTSNTQPYQQPNFNPENTKPYTYQPPNFNTSKGNPQPYSFQPNPTNSNPQPYSYQQPNYGTQNNAQPYQQPDFSSSQSSSYYQHPDNWQNTNPWSNERENLASGSQFSDNRNEISSQKAKPIEINPDENPYLATMPKHSSQNKPSNPPSKGGYI
ncbi:unnamed protein product [Blepharisma stoltei]|uniref:Transmembrane protein n=1 Tax=Blepharisma stoltei TaxID=1481888 RepID=A0AAU9KGZ8_9CILI|nr:unnamed protein product [Blepharisma stoltei]